MTVIIKRRTATKNEERINLLNAIELFDSFPLKEKMVICNHMKLTQWKAHNSLFQEGHRFDRCIFVLQGLVLLTKKTTHKKAIGFEIISHGEPLGVIAVLDEIPMPLTAIALNNCVVAEFSKEEIHRLVKENSLFEKSLNRFAISRFRSMQSFMSQMISATADERVISGLRLFIRRTGIIGKERCIIQVTRRELAIFSGVTTETAIRITKSLEREGRISLKKRKYITILDPSLIEEAT